MQSLIKLALFGWFGDGSIGAAQLRDCSQRRRGDGGGEGGGGCNMQSELSAAFSQLTIGSPRKKSNSETDFSATLKSKCFCFHLQDQEQKRGIFMLNDCSHTTKAKIPNLPLALDHFEFIWHCPLK